MISQSHFKVLVYYFSKKFGKTNSLSQFSQSLVYRRLSVEFVLPSFLLTNDKFNLNITSSQESQLTVR